MGFQRFVLQITLTKDELVSLLLTGAIVDAISLGGEMLLLHGCLDYQRYGKPGDQKGSTNFFNTYVTFRGRSTRAAVRLQTIEGDKYQGTISLSISQSNLSE
jgi:hypothetical protein